MRKVKLFIIGSLLSMAFLHVSCERTEGEGGRASIEGMIYKIVEDGAVEVRNIMEGGELVSEYYFVRDTINAAEEDVYIIYGGNTSGSYDDRVKTSYNGKYKFNYLVSGNYNVFAYDNLPNKDQAAHIHSIKIGSSGKHYIPDMYVMDGKNVGLSAIVGKIKMVNKAGESPGAGLRVYINGEGYVGSQDDVRADNSGTFIFTRLIPGVYDIWAETEPVKNGPIETVHVTVEIKNPSTIVRTVTEGSEEKPIELTVVNHVGGSKIEGRIYKVIDDGNIASRRVERDNGFGGTEWVTEYYFKRDTILAGDEDVYIIYSDDPEEYFEGRERTSHTGIFRFQNLLAGSYTVFAYDNLPNKKQKANIAQVDLLDNDFKILPDMYVRDGKNAGLSAIRGQVKARYGDGNPNGSSIMGFRVYIKNVRYHNITDDVRTDDRGYFVFTKLEPGETYEIWTETEATGKNRPTPEYYPTDIIIPEEGDGNGNGVIIDISANPIVIEVQ
jgi:hypothetical protein